MKAALYLRVSTDEQASEGYSLAAQTKELKEHCKKRNYKIHAIYADEGISGTKEDRPKFQEMIKDAEKGLFNIILVHKFDRFSRNVGVSQSVKNRLKKANVHVLSITEPIEDSPIGFFQEGLLELLSEYFIRNLSKEVKKGQIERASQGLHNGGLPYGYESDNGTVRIIEEQAKVIRKIYDLYNNKGYGYGKIARYLNYSEIKTKTGKTWSHFQVDRILRNVKYAGWIYYSGQVYESKLPTIISKEVFEKAQQLRKNYEGKSFGYRGSNYSKYLLMGLLRCGECGNTFRTWLERKRGYYACNYAMRLMGDGRCDHRKHYNANKLEAFILKEIKSLTENIDVELNIISKEPMLDIINNTRSKLQNELNRAKEAYLNGVFSLDEYALIRKKCERELASLTVPTKTASSLIREQSKKVFQKFESIPEENILERKNLLKQIIHEIKVYKNGINIEFNDSIILAQ